MAKLTQYANKDLEEIMKIEAAQGNEKAAQYKKILSDPDKIMEIFKLSNVENKFIILQNMSEADLDKMLPYLNQEQLAKGLNFFTEEKLMTMCKHLPIEEIIGMVFEKFNLVDVLTLMQEDSMDEFIMQPDVERRYIQEYFAGLDQKALEKIMVKSFGMEMEGKTTKEYNEHLLGLDDSDFNTFILSLERKDKINMIDGVVKQDEELLTLFKPDDLVRPMELIMKQDKIKMMQGLEVEFLAPMIQELPMDLTQIVLTQIDPRDFSEILAEDFQDILSSVVLFKKGMN
jgi:Mg/Co/Ni transporter MgtE